MIGGQIFTYSINSNEIQECIAHYYELEEEMLYVAKKGPGTKK